MKVTSLLKGLLIITMVASMPLSAAAFDQATDAEQAVCTAPDQASTESEPDISEAPDKPYIPGPCCDIPASAWCSSGKGVRTSTGCTCSPASNPAGCALLCPVCW